MKKVLVLVTIFLLTFTSISFAETDFSEVENIEYLVKWNENSCNWLNILQYDLTICILITLLDKAP